MSAFSFFFTVPHLFSFFLFLFGGWASHVKTPSAVAFIEKSSPYSKPAADELSPSLAAANSTASCTIDPALINGIPGLLSLINAPPDPAFPTPPLTPALVTATTINNIPVPAFDLAMGHNLGEIPQSVLAVLSTPDNSSVSSEPQFLGTDQIPNIPTDFLPKTRLNMPATALSQLSTSKPYFSTSLAAFVGTFLGTLLKTELCLNTTGLWSLTWWT
ncbi:hypothetical protein BY996DRAFT_6422116 [Phakopsora pachyrhizi]|nr:hypothetical protein BY996DRAFT_6422116 [Phakopsora pachyrhizi]